MAAKEMSERDFSIFCKEGAKKRLADAFAHAVQDCGMSGEEFYRNFIDSGIARCFENQDTKYVLGRSGREIAHEVFHHMTGKWLGRQHPSNPNPFSSPEYWLGWILAEYQWQSGRTFEDITKFTSLEEMLEMYPHYHEMSEKTFIDKIESMRKDDVPVARF